MNLPAIEGLSPPLAIRTIYCIGRNYAKHARELDNEIPDAPVVFLKPASSVIFNNETIVLPAQSRNVHHEVELVAAIGRETKNISEDEALAAIAGYGLGIDVTARDLQQKAKEQSHPWSVAKGFDTFAPVSRFIPAEELDNPQDIELTLKVNGEVRQHDNTSLMLFPVRKLIAYLSDIFTLYPGDLVFTGTPAGVSPLKDGDRVEAILGNNDLVLSLTVATER